MLKIPRQVSVMISIVFCVLIILMLIAGAIYMPTLVRLLLELPDTVGHRGEAVTNFAIVFCTAVSYMILALAAITDALLLVLLFEVRQGRVFMAKSVACTRFISWCAMGFCLLFLSLGYYFVLSYVVAFAALFVGVVIRVVKNALEEAMTLKSENDLTI